MAKTREELIDHFATRHHLRTKHDPCGEKIVPGRIGENHIFQYSDELLGVVIMPQADNSRIWNSARKAFLAAGMTVTQDCDREGVAIFDPNKKEQVRLAKRYAVISAPKKATAAQLAALAEYRSSKTRQNQSDHVQVSREPEQRF